VVVATAPRSEPRWKRVCTLSEILPCTGVTARIGRRQVALFRIGGRVYALDNRDPFSGRQVLARGIVGDRAGVPKVASPLYKQSFALETGACLDDPAVAVRTDPCRVSNGNVYVAE